MADAMPDAIVDASPDAELATGAMPVPDDGDDPWKAASLDEVDTTVAIRDVRGTRGPWPERKRLRMRGRVMVALQSDAEHGALHLAVIEPDEGRRADVTLREVTAEAFHHAFDGDTYLSRQRDDETGPILFAVRVLPPAGARDSERTQVVVFADGASLRVVEKRVSEAAWHPRLRLDCDRGATFVGIGTTDPH